MRGSRKKMPKAPFWSFLAKKGHFVQCLSKMGKTGFFFKNAFGTFFSLLKALINCKVSEKSNERFSRNRVTYGRTHGRESLGLQRLRRETKNSTKTSILGISKGF